MGNLVLFLQERKRSFTFSCLGVQQRNPESLEIERTI